jgi:hypothetical protein
MPSFIAPILNSRPVYSGAAPLLQPTHLLPGLIPATHVFKIRLQGGKDVDGRNKSGQWDFG